MISPLFATGAAVQIEQQLLARLQAQRDVLSPHTLQSPRAAGDAIERMVASELEPLLGTWAQSYAAQFARRAMADIAFTDANGYNYVVDVKTHRLGTQFNRPNLISVERLARFYEDDHNIFALLVVTYRLENDQLAFSAVQFLPIEWLSWSCLTIGALGWGQLQLADAAQIVTDSSLTRRAWMLQLCDSMLAFYPREIQKIHQRMGRFEAVRAMWQAKDEEESG